MAIAFDSQSGNQIEGSSRTSQTFSHTCSGTDRVLIVGIGSYNGTGGNKVSGITYNGVAMTKVDQQMAVTNQDHSLWYLVAPATGTNSIVASFATQTYIWTSAASYTGVDQSAPEASNKQYAVSGVGFTGEVTTLSDNAWVISSFHDGDGSATTAGASTTRRYSTDREALYDTNVAVTPAGAVVLNFGVLSTTQRGSITISLAPAGGAPSPAYVPRVQMY